MNRLKFKTAGKLPIILEFHRIYPNLVRENRRIWTCNRLDLQTLGCQLVIMPKNLPDHRLAMHVAWVFRGLRVGGQWSGRMTNVFGQLQYVLEAGLCHCIRVFSMGYRLVHFVWRCNIHCLRASSTMHLHMRCEPVSQILNTVVRVVVWDFYTSFWEVDFFSAHDVLAQSVIGEIFGHNNRLRS